MNETPEHHPLSWDQVIFIPRHISPVYPSCSELKQSTFDQKFRHQAGKHTFIACLDLVYFIMMLSCKIMCGEKVGTETFSTESPCSQQSCLCARYFPLVCDLCVLLLSISRALLTCLIFTSSLVGQPKQCHSLGGLESTISKGLYCHSSTDPDLNEVRNKSLSKPKIRN